MQKYLNYVVSTQALKGVPAFDSQIEGINNATTLSDAIRQNVRLMNPMSFTYFLRV